MVCQVKCYVAGLFVCVCVYMYIIYIYMKKIFYRLGLIKDRGFLYAWEETTNSYFILTPFFLAILMVYHK